MDSQDYEELYDGEKFLQELASEFSEEEKAIYNKVQSKIQQRIAEHNQASMQENQKNMSSIMEDKNMLVDDPIHSRHVTNYDREIFVDLKMEISATNKEGVLTEVAPILQDYYHIPVPSGSNYTSSISSFVSVLETNLSELATKIFRKNEPEEIHI